MEMEIDIIDYTAGQYAALSTDALEEILKAQRRKDALVVAFEKKKATEKRKMIDRGCFLSNVWERLEEEMTEEHEAEVTVLREKLLFYLHYADNGGGAELPYPVDYSLSVEGRMAVLRDYYVGAYDDALERFEAFDEDTFARTYLGEGYASLWQYMKNFTK